MFPRKSHGMTLVEVLISVAVAAIVMTAMATMMSDVFKSQRTVQSKDANREITQNIRALLTDPLICQASFAGGNLSLPSSEVTSKDRIIGDDGVVHFQTNQTYLNDLVKITGFTIKNYVPDNSTVSNLIGKADLVISMNKVGATVGGIEMRVIIYLQVILDSAGLITQCYSIGGADWLWRISPANMSDIYYRGGNVGIGIANPEFQLDVVATTDSGVDTRGIHSTLYSGTSNHYGGSFITREARGTISSPGGVVTGDYLGWFGFQGFDGSGFVPALNPSGMTSRATETWGITATVPHYGSSLQFWTTSNGSANGTERLVIDQSGAVGIGISSPTAKLDVYGTASDTPSEANAVLNLRTTNQGYGIIFGNSLTYGHAWIQTTVNGVPSNGVPTNTASLAINPTGGNVGIGTSNPSTQFEIANSVGRMQMFASTANNEIGTLIGASDSWGLGATTGGAAFYFANTSSGGAVMKSYGSKDLIFQTWENYSALPATGGSDRMRIHHTTGKVDILGDTEISGNVGIGGAPSTTATVKLNVAGDINSSGSNSASSFMYTSDQRLKEDIVPIEDSLEKILKLRPVKFRWKNNHKDDYGFIAQEVEQIIPEITSVDSLQIKRVDYAKIIPFLVDQIQRQQKEIDLLKEKIK